MPKNQQPDLIDHIGVDLWRAMDVWKSRFSAQMAAAGYPYFAEARGGLIAHIDRSGTPQASLVLRSGMTKQAVQQLLDELVRDGVVVRKPDPEDARKKWVNFTPAGLEALAHANKVKRGIEADFNAQLGEEGFEALRQALKALGKRQTAL